MNHWTDGQITQWLYGLAPDADTHLDHCIACRDRAGAALSRRKLALQAPEVSWDFLAAQRRAIYQRMDRPRPLRLHARWITSLAVLIMAAVLGFNSWRSFSQPAPLVSPSDARLYSELVDIDQSTEPRAIRPIQNLFEE